MTQPTLTLPENVTLTEDGTQPLILSATFSDLDGDFTGAVLTVSGLLATDRIGITPGSTITVQGDLILSSGVAIATRTGGSGSDLIITFNANANNAAIQSLIQMLNFANASNTPTATRTLSFGFTDAAGETLAGGPQALDVTVNAVDDAPQAHISGREVLGPEILVNTATLGTQNAQQIVTLAGGDAFVVIWSDSSVGDGGAGGDGTGTAIKGQMFTAAGVPIGQEFLVNSATSSNQSTPQVAALQDGGFLVTWNDSSLGVGGAGGDTTSTAVKAQRYDADGARAGGEFLVNSATAGSQSGAQIAVLSTGGFAIVWNDASLGVGGAGGDADSGAVKLQVYDEDGVRVGVEILVNTATAGNQSTPLVKALGDGRFFVTWQDASAGVGGAEGDSTNSALKGQLFDAVGNRIGGEILINTATVGNQTTPVTAALADGSFVIAWNDTSTSLGGAEGDNSGSAIKAQRFDEDGNKLGDEFLVNTAIAATQLLPKIIALTGGGFAISWTDNSAGTGGTTGDSSAAAVKLQVYTADGVRVGIEILVNTATANSQTSAQMLALDTGGFVIAWEDGSIGNGGAGNDTSSVAVKAQVFNANGTKQGTEFLVNTATAGAQNLIQLAALHGGEFAVTWVDVSAGVGGARGDTSGAAVKAQLFGTGHADGGYRLMEGGTLDLKGHFSVHDSDSPEIVASVSVASGTLSASAGASGVTLLGSGTSSLTVIGTVAAINAFFATDATSTISYTNTSPSPPADVTLTLLVDDGVSSSSVTQKLNVMDIPYAPESQDATLTVAEDGRLTLTTANFAYSDPDGVSSLAAVTITTLPTHGTLYLDTDGPGGAAPSPVSAGSTFTTADIAAGKLTYVPDPNANGAGYASFTFQVRDFAATLNVDPTPNTITINVTPVGDPHVLTGWTAGTILTEGAANGRTIIDTSAIFTDPDGNFGGGQLTVTGLLSEDRISVLDQGNGAGQLSVSGATLSYGGVAIGTITGGTGNNFAISFNASATTAAVDAVIEHLTYQNLSDNPTASRQLILNLVDSDGYQSARPTFAEVTGAANPLSGIDLGRGASYAFIDIDGDGDKDILASGSAQFKVRAFQNNGPGTAFTELTGSANPMNAISFVQAAKVAAGDVDGDGDLDLVAGLGSGTFGNSGQIRVFINRGPGLSYFESSAFAGGVDLGTNATPTFADFDNDGDLDLVSGEQGGFLYAFRNDGFGSFTQLTGSANPFNGIRVHNNQSMGTPSFMDLDGDGDADLIMGSNDGWLAAYRNNGAGQAFTEFLPNPVGNLEALIRAAGKTQTTPTVGDVDGDGDLDLIVSSFVLGAPQVFLNNPDVGVAFNITVRAQNDVPTLSGLATAVTFAENAANAGPVLIDADIDFADPDASFSGGYISVSGQLPEDRLGVRSQGTGPGQISIDGSSILFGGVVVGTMVGGAGAPLNIVFNPASTGAAVDAVLQNLTYQNVSDTPVATRTLTIDVADGTGAKPISTPIFAQAAGWDNPFNNGVWQLNGANVVGPQPNDVVIRMADLDNNGLPDALIGNGDGTLKLYSSAIRWDGAFILPNALPFNAFAGIDVGDHAAPALVDLNGDGQLDAVVGNGAGELLAFTSSGPGTSYFAMAVNPFAGIDVGDRAAPGFVDLDGDGDLDMVVGNAEGALLAFRNNGAGTAFTAMTGGDNPFDGVDVGANAIPDFADIDGDGDKDALVGTADGTILAFRNNGNGSFTQLLGAANPFNGVDVGSNAAPGVVDLNGDGSPDLIVGDSDMFPSAFRSHQDGSRITVTVTAQNDAPLVTPGTAGVAFVEQGAAVAIAPNLTVTDAEGTPVARAAVLIAGAFHPEDLLAFVNDNPTLFGDITAAFDANPTRLVLTSLGGATAAQFEAALRAVTFANGSDDPGLSREIWVTVEDALGANRSVLLPALTITPVDDLATAGDDTGQTAENAVTILSVLTNDTDPDNPRQVAAIEGNGVAPGDTITLASGATVTLNLDGTLSYDPNGAYNWLISASTAAATGASYASMVESFSYTLTDGGLATVQVTVNGVDTPGDQLLGNSGADVITGTSMNDVIDGRGGADRMIGGLGDDIFYVAEPGDTAEERPGEGNDTVRATISYSLVGQFVENLVLTGSSAINGTGNGLANSLTGNDAANTLDGGAGNDIIDGADGVDTMIGGLGDDLFYVGQAGDTAIEAANGGYDTVRASISFSLAGQYLERLILTGGAAINGTGNSLANVLIGNSAANTLDGGDGNDDIDGGGGADTMIGGLGDDVFHIDQLGDLAVEAGGSGSDTVRASISYSLAGQYIESLILTGGNAINGTGNSLANTLTGNGAANILTGLEGNDTIDGGGGGDTMIGGLGDDIYHVDNAGDLAVEINGEGTDTVNASITYSLAGQFIENLNLTGANAINGTGNKLANILTGNSAANTLSGGEGNDTINGHGGIDTMIGGLGDDTFYIDDVGDIAIELNLEGHDAVISSITYSLSGQYIEDLTLTGSANIDATGNRLANIITGNSGANQIHGGLGADMLTGGAGADGFWFDTALDGSFDTITDFQVGTDMFHLDRGIFAGLLDSGPLGADAFALGATAQDADDRILYDSATGKIYYDEDGSGAAAAVVIAQVNPGTALTDADFTLF